MLTNREIQPRARFGLQPYAPHAKVESRVIQSALDEIDNYITAAENRRHWHVAENGVRAHNAIIAIKNNLRPYPNISMSKDSLLSWAFEIARNEPIRVGRA